ncbi:MAG TPA: type II toxin-antitoxin system HicB family antitoxin [Beijerinckiaceae bacterium]|nr:type II toxin-antitoxin system HicB family antitoxin [Beijerinckiaceae bacterium]
MASYIGLMDGKPGAYGLVVPDLPGCTTMGKTAEAVYRNAIEAVRIWAQDAIESGDALPAPRDMEALRADPEVAAPLREGASFVHVPLLIDRGMPTRANVSIDKGLLDAIDEAAAERGLTRSAFLASAARDKIQQGR